MPRNVAQKIDPSDIVIAHISDPHFGSDRADEVWNLVTQELREIQPDLYLVTGDLAHTPDERLFDSAKAKMEGLPTSGALRYYVCAGNHDRHWMGNRISPIFGLFYRHPIRLTALLLWILGTPLLVGILSGAVWVWGAIAGGMALIALWVAWRVNVIRRSGLVGRTFNAKFEGRILTAAPQELVLYPAERPDERPWKLGLFGADSSLHGRMLACGSIDSTTLTAVQQTQCECDVCIFLVHHHLLSIAALEGKTQDKWMNLLNATSLFNSGRVLEALTKAHADVVLHGHEHSANYVGYSSVEPGRGPLRVVSAGSATGNDSFEGCREDHATFNVLILSRDRSIRMRRHFRNARGEWEVEEFPLLDAATLRHSRLRRSRRALGPIEAEITKSLTFTQERDVWVHWVYTNTSIRGRSRLTQHVRNSTGEPDNVRFTISRPDAQPVRLDGRARLVSPNTWELLSDNLSSELQRWSGSVQIVLEYRWRCGGLLTSEELKAVCNGSHERLREDGFEFAVARVPDEPDGDDLAFLELIVSLPFEYVPPDDPIVRVNDTLTALELEQQLRVLAPGLFVLRVPYPLKGFDYQIAWKPPRKASTAKSVDGETPEQIFDSIARQRGRELLSGFSEMLSKTTLGKPDALSIYVKRKGEMRLEIAASIESPTQPNLLPHEVLLFDQRAGLARAWWGEPNLEKMALPQKAEPAAQQLLKINLPVRFSFQTIAPPSWAVIAIVFEWSRISKVDSLTQPTYHGRVWEMLFPGVAQMLSDAFAKEWRSEQSHPS